MDTSREFVSEHMSWHSLSRGRHNICVPSISRSSWRWYAFCVICLCTSENVCYAPIEGKLHIPSALFDSQ